MRGLDEWVDGWEDDRGERLCPGCSFCVCRARDGAGGGVEKC